MLASARGVPWQQALRDLQQLGLCRALARAEQAIPRVEQQDAVAAADLEQAGAAADRHRGLVQHRVGARAEAQQRAEGVVRVDPGQLAGARAAALRDVRPREAGDAVHLAEPPAQAVDQVRARVEQPAAAARALLPPRVCRALGIGEQPHVVDGGHRVRRADEALVEQLLDATALGLPAELVVDHRHPPARLHCARACAARRRGCARAASRRARACRRRARRSRAPGAGPGSTPRSPPRARAGRGAPGGRSARAGSRAVPRSRAPGPRRG